MPLDAERAHRAVEKIAKKLRLTVEDAAAGILRVANANMERAIRMVSVERGYDPRKFALVAFGGCGGLHACEIAQELGIQTIIAPQSAGALSALGMLMADAVRDYAAGVLGQSPDKMELAYRALERRARRESTQPSIERSADIRYQGQSYEISVPWRSARSAAREFHTQHQKLYGYSHLGASIEVVTIRVQARSKVAKPRMAATNIRASAPAGSRKQEVRGRGVPERKVWLSGKWNTISVSEHSELASNSSRPLEGPALVLDYGSTTLVPRGWKYYVDKVGNLIIQCQRRSICLM